MNRNPLLASGWLTIDWSRRIMPFQYCVHHHVIKIFLVRLDQFYRQICHVRVTKPIGASYVRRNQVACAP